MADTSNTAPLSPTAQAIADIAAQEPKVAAWLAREPKEAGIFSDVWMEWFNEEV